MQVLSEVIQMFKKLLNIFRKQDKLKEAMIRGILTGGTKNLI